MANLLTVLICTHNRAPLLSRALESLNAAMRPAAGVELLVVANACTDETHSLLAQYVERAAANGSRLLPLRWIREPTPGKSHALNRAIPEIATELTAFVDDDHRVAEDYLVAIERTAQTWPELGIYCGRIMPDWDGTEPAWVHDEGPYRIYPLPVPRYDQGRDPKPITAKEGPIPGGGNLVFRRTVFEVAGQFSTELGPLGHNLGGGEDTEYVLRAMTRGVRCQYTAAILQYHFVDKERLKLGYLLRKSYQRTRSTSRIHGDGKVPLYMWRKLAEYIFHSIFSLSWERRRFYWIRTAAALGEVKGRSESGNQGKALDLRLDRGLQGTQGLALLTLASGLLAWGTGTGYKWNALWPAVAAAGICSAALVTKSLLDFSQTGPRIRGEILSRYRRYTLFAIARLAVWAFIIMLFTAGGGTLIYYVIRTAAGWQWSAAHAVVAAFLGIFGSAALQFIRKLRFNPGLLVASMHYRASRLYPLWRWATPGRIKLVQGLLIVSTGLLVIAGSVHLWSEQRFDELVSMWTAALFYVGIVIWAGWLPEPGAPRKETAGRGQGLPNILMIGSDTLRADRISALGYRRKLTPNIDALASRSTFFSNCYVPCARTAPSLISLLTGAWPQTHGIRDNFVSSEDTRLSVFALPQLLKPLGYRTAAFSDWCGADMGKFSLGFDYTELPEDQWNLKYLIRQGPKDLRLFLSLFIHNRLGRLFLPELYYLGGVPLTGQMGPRARDLVSRMASSEDPFFLNVFYSTTHPPFASEWPWYTLFADPAYEGESKFAMARLTDPFDIIRRQGAPKEEFDLDHIIDLYDGCVAQFDDEVGRMLHHLDLCGLADNTIIVVYSDHGMEFFEHETWGQGNSAVGEASPRIPLLIHDPRAKGNGVVSHVVRSIDLAPTLLNMVGATPPATMDGVSLANCLHEAAECPELDAFNETGVWITNIPGLPEEHLRYPDLFELLEVPDRESGTLAVKRQYEDATLRAKDRMIRSGRWKLVFQPLTQGYVLRLFDLEADPDCQKDLSSTAPEITRHLWTRLTQWMKRDSADCRPLDRNDTTDCAATARPQP
jgi:arylsulfatase A-like enzyme/glycosyltransferase involved in cell wall biosynthesis